jgi:hypothetical protein
MAGTLECAARVPQREPVGTGEPLSSEGRSEALAVVSGVPVLIDQLVEMLRDERHETPEPPMADIRERRCAADPAVSAAIGKSAVKHGADLMRRGFTVDQVVHDYGDVCQAVTELAHEQAHAISVDEFHTFNRCPDLAIAVAVTEFGRNRGPP